MWHVHRGSIAVLIDGPSRISDFETATSQRNNVRREAAVRDRLAAVHRRDEQRYRRLGGLYLVGIDIVN